MPHTNPWLALLFVGSALFAGPALAQSQSPGTQSPPTGFWLTTPFPALTLRAGETGDISLTLKNSGLPPQRADLEVKGLPAGWTSELKGEGRPVTAAIVQNNDSQLVTLDLTPPADASSGTYKFEVDAHYGTDTAALPIAVTLSAKKPGGIKLEPSLPALRGTPKTTFDYQVKITNNGSSKELFNLAAQTPPGFTTTFKHGYGSAEITGVPIAAGANDTVTLEVKANSSINAGKYPVTMEVSGGNMTAKADLGLEITGSPNLSLTGPQQRLSGEAVAGQSKSFPFTIENTGSAPAQNVKFSADAPTDWTVTFDPATLPSIKAGDSQTVNVSIKPSDKAIAGDYVVNVNANGDGVTQSAQFRVTVNTSTIWGIVGLIVIAIAAIILVLAVLRYGRR